VDSGADLNEYAKVENQAACCSPSMEAGSPFQVIEAACCAPAASEPSLHEELTTLLSQYDVNAAAASVKVYAVKPVKTAQTACCGPTCCAPTAAL
jgi:arsenite methyltransferase